MSIVSFFKAPPPEVTIAVRAKLEELGPIRAAEFFELSRSAVDRLAGGLRCHIGTVVQARLKLGMLNTNPGEGSR